MVRHSGDVRQLHAMSGVPVFFVCFLAGLFLLVVGKRSDPKRHDFKSSANLRVP